MQAPPSPLGRRARSRHGDPAHSWIRTGLVLTCAFLVWLVMDATVLAAQRLDVAPSGRVGSFALDILSPLGGFSRLLGIDLPVVVRERGARPHRRRRLRHPDRPAVVDHHDEPPRAHDHDDGAAVPPLAQAPAAGAARR